MGRPEKIDLESKCPVEALINEASECIRTIHELTPEESKHDGLRQLAKSENNWPSLTHLYEFQRVEALVHATDHLETLSRLAQYREAHSRRGVVLQIYLAARTMRLIDYDLPQLNQDERCAIERSKQRVESLLKSAARFFTVVPDKDLEVLKAWAVG